jgi:hypothetical protein
VLAAFTSCGDSHPTPALGSEHSGSALASATDSGNAIGRPTSVVQESLRGSQPASTPLLASALSSQQSLSPPIVASPSASLQTQGTPLSNGGVVAPSSSTITSSGGVNTAIGSAVGSGSPEAGGSNQSTTIPTGSGGGGGDGGSGDGSSGLNSAATNQIAPESGTAKLSSNAQVTPTPNSVGILPTAMNTQIVTTPGAPSPAGPLVSGGSTASRNSTMTLSPAATDALLLMQFLKNFGVTVFNSSSQVTASSPDDNRNSTSLTESSATMLLVSTDLVRAS